MSLLTQDYADMIRNVGSLLDGNCEWIQRYKNFISDLNDNRSIIIQASREFGNLTNHWPEYESSQSFLK